MNVRYFFTAVCGNVALGIAVFANTLPVAGVAQETLTVAAVLRAGDTRISAIREIEPGYTGHAEIDDLPAYLTPSHVAE